MFKINSIMFSFKKKDDFTHNCDEINKFYNMLLKMKKKRPKLNINWIMSGLYGIDYEKYINKN